MEIKYTKSRIELEKELTALDNLAIRFTSVLTRFRTKHVLVSGYVSILFGRTRASEDIDLIVEKMTFAGFRRLWEELRKECECLNTKKPSMHTIDIF